MSVRYVILSPELSRLSILFAWDSNGEEFQQAGEGFAIIGQKGQAERLSSLTQKLGEETRSTEEGTPHHYADTI